MKKRKVRRQKPVLAAINEPIVASATVGLSVWAQIKSRWHSLSAFNHHWLINIFIGVLIEAFVHFGGHSLHFSPIVSFQNWGLDVVTQLNVGTCKCLGVEREVSIAISRFLKCPQTASRDSVPVLVDIDAQTWRDPSWGGGEPYRAPREKLVALIDQSFKLGAKQVVLDIVVEDGTASPADIPANEALAKLAHVKDQAFAQGLSELLSKEYFGTDRRLILTRTLRDPLPFQSDTNAFFGELRGSALVDAVIKDSHGRIVVAAPYFQEGSDRITRDWDLFKVVCERSPGDPNHGVLRVVPSVQLASIHPLPGIKPATAAAPNVHAAESNRACVPFPQSSPSTMPEADSFAQACLHAIAVDGSAAAVDSGMCKQAKKACIAASKTPDYGNFTVCPDLITRIKSIEAHAPGENDGLNHEYWSAVQSKMDKSTTLGDLPHQGGLGNRIVFRYTADQVKASADSISARSLLAEPKGLSFEGRTVVIGQTYQETGDFFRTPVGRMPGAVVLINAIDSMAKHQLMTPPSGWITLPTAFGLIVFIGFLFARWDSMIGATIAVVIVVLTAGVASFFFFAHGVWFDFAAPIIGIQLHRWFASLEERAVLKRLSNLHGKVIDAEVDKLLQSRTKK